LAGQADLKSSFGCRNAPDMRAIYGVNIVSQFIFICLTGQVAGSEVSLAPTLRRQGMKACALDHDKPRQIERSKTPIG
jgi:hypothetical protein